jgi:hypothetical protein
VTLLTSAGAFRFMSTPFAEDQRPVGSGGVETVAVPCPKHGRRRVTVFGKAPSPLTRRYTCCGASAP